MRPITEVAASLGLSRQHLTLFGEDKAKVSLAALDSGRPPGKLILVSAVARPGVVELVDVQSGKRTPWKEFHPPDPAGVLQIEPFVISADGASYVYSYRRLLDELYLVTGLR
jgi:formate--tetrahydrofolate ligase